MKYFKSTISTVIENSLPSEKTPRLTPEQIAKLKTISKVALAVIAGAGIISLALVAPQMFVAIDKLFLKKPGRPKLNRKDKRLMIAKTVYYLKQNKIIMMRPDGQDFKIFLTRLGRARLKKINFGSLDIGKPKSWNGKWWQVAADIPTKKYKWRADLLREKLKEMGFFPLQRTLWFYPYDPRREVELVANHYNVDNFVTVMEVSRLDLDDEQKMKKFFRNQKLFK